MMTAPAYIPGLSAFKNKRLRATHEEKCGHAKHAELAAATNFDLRKPRASWSCPATGKRMWASACADRRRCANLGLVEVLEETCGKCERNRKEGTQ